MRDVTDCGGFVAYVLSNFYSHVPCGTWLTPLSDKPEKTVISTHTSHAGRDIICCLTCSWSIISTHTSHAGRDGIRHTRTSHLWISTHTSHAGRDKRGVDSSFEFRISTHTSHAGRDRIDECGNWRAIYFYSHVPCGTWPLHFVLLAFTSTRY